MSADQPREVLRAGGLSYRNEFFVDGVVQVDSCEKSTVCGKTFRKVGPLATVQCTLFFLWGPVSHARSFPTCHAWLLDTVGRDFFGAGDVNAGVGP